MNTFQLHQVMLDSYNKFTSFVNPTEPIYLEAYTAVTAMLQDISGHNHVDRIHTSGKMILYKKFSII